MFIYIYTHKKTKCFSKPDLTEPSFPSPQLWFGLKKRHLRHLFRQIQMKEEFQLKSRFHVFLEMRGTADYAI